MIGGRMSRHTSRTPRRRMPTNVCPIVTTPVAAGSKNAAWRARALGVSVTPAREAGIVVVAVVMALRGYSCGDRSAHRAACLDGDRRRARGQRGGPGEAPRRLEDGRPRTPRPGDDAPLWT